MKIVAISDTHLQHDFEMLDGDVLVHAGDLTFRGDLKEMARAITWLGSFKPRFKDIVAICGNHDWLGETHAHICERLFKDAGITYLERSSATIQGVKFWGAPHTPRFFDWAFNVDRGADLERIWAQIPTDTQVLVTHGPPKGHLDTVRRPGGEPDAMDFGAFGKGDSSRAHHDVHVGCWNLAQRIQKLPDLKVHIFGHIHRPGIELGESGKTYVNASICNEQYKAVHKPIIIDLPQEIK